MSGQLIAHTLFTAQLIFSNDLSGAQREAFLSPYFEPRPGSELIMPLQRWDNPRLKDPLDMRGFITITPPEGQCFMILPGNSGKELMVCKKREVPYTFRDLDNDGSLKWRVTISSKDVGTTVSWRSSYRIMQAVFLNISPEKEAMDRELAAAAEAKQEVKDAIRMKYSHAAVAEFIPILNCRSEQEKNERRVTLQLPKGEQIAIVFPPVDTLEEQPPDPPNLFINKKLRVIDAAGERKKAASDAALSKAATEAQAKASQQDPHAAEDDKDKATEQAEETGKEQKSHGAEGKKESGAKGDQKQGGFGLTNNEEEIKERERARWMIPARGTFRMDSSHVRVPGSANAKNGVCRYRYSNATSDRESGVIECFDVGSYDHFYAHMTCSAVLQNSNP
jgi:hypothetical protein